MRAYTTRSTFRPPPFVSVSKGTGFAPPTHPVFSSQHTPAPTLLTRPSVNTPSPFTTEAENASLPLPPSDVPGGWWNVSDVNFTSPPAVVTSEVTSAAAPYFPAGYPSGYTWPHIICASVIVTIVILIIVVGNFLVMWAIVTDKNLKGTQNYFIGSLALADFLLGLLIVPFSLANELMGYWHFGTVFCEVWKAVDVLLCTASISSLCLISLDRYWSITKAIHYSRQRTPKRAAVMIFIVWFVSAAICIPPLIGWNQPAPDSDWPICALSEDIGYVLYSSMGSFYIPAFIMVFVYFKIYQAAKARARKNVTKAPRGMQSEKGEQKNSTESSGTDHHQHAQRAQEPSQYSLDMTATQQDVDLLEDSHDNQLKVPPVLSSSVEELTPAAPSAVSQCQCVNEILEDATPPQAATSEDESSRQLLDFRSRSLSLPCRALRSDELTKLISTDSDSCDALAGPSLNQLGRQRPTFLSMPTTTTTTDTDSSIDLTHLQQLQQPQPCHRHHHHQTYNTTPQYVDSSASPPDAETPAAGTPVPGSPVAGMTEGPAAAQQDNGAVQSFKMAEPKQNGNAKKGGPAQSGVSGSGSRPGRQQSSGLLGSLRRQLFQTNNGKVGERHKAPHKKKEQHRKAGGRVPTEDKNDFFSAERQKRKLAKARERRATLVLGLVMAAFILCWLPFFLLYVASAFCEGCIPMMVFTVFFWIGYCNSALNPIIYTVFNRDFRRAFHRILFGRRPGRR